MGYPDRYDFHSAAQWTARCGIVKNPSDGPVMKKSLSVFADEGTERKTRVPVPPLGNMLCCSWSRTGIGSKRTCLIVLLAGVEILKLVPERRREKIEQQKRGKINNISQWQEDFFNVTFSIFELFWQCLLWLICQLSDREELISMATHYIKCRKQNLAIYLSI